MAHGTQWLTLDSDTSHDTSPTPGPPWQPSPMAVLPQEMTASPVWAFVCDTPDQQPPRQKRHHWLRYVLLMVGLCAAIVAGRVIHLELRTSERQARYFSALAEQLTFHMAPGPSPSVRFPTTGPYNRRLGYAHLPVFLERLMAGIYVFEAQARLSPRLQRLIDLGIFPIYHEKTQAGLRILDRHGAVMFAARYPHRVYADFDDIPELIVQTLLFIENRELLDPDYPHRNPAVEWDRLARALFDMSVHVINKDHHVAGGSTLATQIEKFRHSPEGQTASGVEKLRQMVSASIRAYIYGEKTLPAQRQIILDYINAIPLAAQRGYGEVHGLGDGLWAWYDADVARVNRILADRGAEHSAAGLKARALAYKQVLSLFIAHRRPSFYLLGKPPSLMAHTHTYLRMLSRAGLISPALCNAALQENLQVQKAAAPDANASFAARKGVNLVRTDLLTQLNLPGLYDLDRLDLTVQSTLDKPVQEAVTKVLHALQDTNYVASNGLMGKGLLAQDADPGKVRYSLVLYERGAKMNLLRIHTDNVDQPFDINTGIKLDLGSTAKLRTLITYLQVIATLHHNYAGLPRSVLRTVQVHASDRLTRWVLDYLLLTPNASLSNILDAAMSRRYSASPYARFFTGGGLHTFANFDREDNDRVLSVRQAFRHSVNLVFIRMMRDIVRYYMFCVPGSTAKLLEDRRHPERHLYLSQFADQEGRVFVNRFYHKYAGKSSEDVLRHLLDAIHPTPKRLATVFGAIVPDATAPALADFLHAYLPQKPAEKHIQALYTRYVKAAFTWADRGYLARLHPLELWVATYLYHHPEADRQDLMTASIGVRQEVYRWLFQTRYKHAQDRRIRTLLEAEAFLEIHKAWQRLGYPFDSLVPSYATAIGSSADRPDALAELMGIIVNDGLRYPLIRVEQLHFAAGTPYETKVAPISVSKPALAPQIAAVVKTALIDVVEHGTARRIRGVFKWADGSRMRLGGKTGTGDHRRKRYAADARLIDARVVNRAAVFMFMIDDRFFGTLTVYVPGTEAADYSFTSSLPVQVLKVLAPALQPLLRTKQMPTVAMVSPANAPEAVPDP